MMLDSNIVVDVTLPSEPFSPRCRAGSPCGRWDRTAGGRSPSCGTRSRSRPAGSPGCCRRAAGCPAARCRTSPSSPSATPSRCSHCCYTYSTVTCRSYSFGVLTPMCVCLFVCVDTSRLLLRRAAPRAVDSTRRYEVFRFFLDIRSVHLDACSVDASGVTL